MKSRYQLMFFALLLFTAGSVNSWRGMEAEAAELGKFDVGPQGIAIAVPNGWTAITEIEGMDLALVGPEITGTKAVITVNHLGESGEIELQDPKGNERAYQRQREEWLSENGGTFLRLVPYRKVSIGESKGFSIGHRYILDGDEAVDVSYNIVCRGNAYNVHTSVPAKIKTATDEAETIVNSFTCSAVGAGR